MSVVIGCRMADGRRAVLKVSPDRIRLVNEAAALESWATAHTPSVLAVDESALLHGDLTPSNILDGGSERGLVAIDPAPCLGDDLAFDAVDLLLWQADDVELIAARAEQLARARGVDAGRMLDWCIAFAGMTALELAEAPESSRGRLEAALTLARQAPTGQA
jgi:streptomycin 6-kinase